MTLKRVLPFFVIIFTLTGCFRQANDTFDTVDSRGGGTNIEAATQVINATPTEESAITIIAPGMDDMTPEETATEIQAAAVDADATEIPPTLFPTATNPPPPDASSSDVLPTATTGTFITPEAVVEVVIPSATPAIIATRNPALQPTPSDETALAGEEPVSDCEYVVQAGDNAFRIALNNGVSLDDLLAVNDLPPEPIIQPGQRLIIPGCQDGTSVTVDTVEATAEVGAETTAEPAVVLEDGYRLHVVAAGETLLSIARQYDVTVNEIIAANADLTDPNRIAQGQELLIPPGN